MAVRSDAATDRMSRSGGAPDPQAGFTLCGWFYLSVDRDDFSTMARLHASSGGTTRLTVATGPSGTTPAVFTPGNTSGIIGVDSFTVGSWLWVAVTQTGTTATLYTYSPGGTLNSTSGTASGGAAPDGYTIFGRSPSDASEWFNGRGACVRLWATVLTAGELPAERDSFTAVKTAGLYADYRLATASDLADHSGNGRDLTPGSTSVTTEDDPPLGTTVTDAGTATLTLTATGTATKTMTAAGTAGLVLTADGVSLPVRAGAGSAVLTLSAAGTAARVAAGSGTATLTLVATGTTPLDLIAAAVNPRLTIRPNQATAVIRANQATLTIDGGS
jgi:hypothetical protein